MPIDDQNPYAAPVSELSITRPRAHRVRSVSAITLLVFGLGTSALGLLVLVIGTIAVLSAGNMKALPGMLAVCSMYFGASISWLIAARFIRKQRYRRGVIAAVVGALIPTVLVLILGV